MNVDYDIMEENPKYLSKKKIKEAKRIIDNEKAKVAAVKFLQDNPTINIGCLIDQLKSMILSTITCAAQLGISPSAFLRLRKKYNIEPVYTIKNKTNSEEKKFMPYFSKKAIKNFYTSQQLEMIPKSEIDLIQIRSARSLNFPNGKNVPVKWVKRGFHSNGKLRARVNHLMKFGLYAGYDEKNDKYYIYSNKERKLNESSMLTKKEVDKLNYQYGKLKVFL